MKEQRHLCIIPARGGSKRIPRKNIRPFHGRPILEWSVSAALQTGIFDRVMVSTDDEEIAEIARRAGANVPLMRSAEASDDHATTPDVLIEVLNRYGEDGDFFDLGCCLYPTAPFVTPEDLVQGRDLLITAGFNAVMPIAAFSYPIWRSLKRDSSGRVTMNFQEHLSTRSQDLPPAYHDAGQWYWFRTADFLRDQVLLGPNTGSILLPETRVQDIDNEDDWRLAEIKHEGLFG